ncbi:hypothetical protein [Neobacillus sp.]|uniref:hypothetical protein n=1 Tax=Neobacillus sp. TaxID=2675273 RepID=UPI00289C8BE2|nr:hypothetical protein [Neobacillus sp.]
MNRKVVLAAGTGFLGQSLAHFLESKGYQRIERFIINRKLGSCLTPKPTNISFH